MPQRISQIQQGIYFVIKDLCLVSKHRSFSGGGEGNLNPGFAPSLCLSRLLLAKPGIPFGMRGALIEPCDESHLIRLSPSAAVRFRFPSRTAEWQAVRYGSHYAVTGRVAPLRSRSPLIDASVPAAVLRGNTARVNEMLKKKQQDDEDR